jgi:hypothetical protein
MAVCTTEAVDEVICGLKAEPRVEPTNTKIVTRSVRVD